jgi:hypothetical protein
MSRFPQGSKWPSQIAHEVLIVYVAARDPPCLNDTLTLMKCPNCTVLSHNIYNVIALST